MNTFDKNDIKVNNTLILKHSANNSNINFNNLKNIVSSEDKFFYKEVLEVPKSYITNDVNSLYLGYNFYVNLYKLSSVEIDAYYVNILQQLDSVEKIDKFIERIKLYYPIFVANFKDIFKYAEADMRFIIKMNYLFVLILEKIEQLHADDKHSPSIKENIKNIVLSKTSFKSVDQIDIFYYFLLKIFILKKYFNEKITYNKMYINSLLYKLNKSDDGVFKGKSKINSFMRKLYTYFYFNLREYITHNYSEYLTSESYYNKSSTLATFIIKKDYFLLINTIKKEKINDSLYRDILGDKNISYIIIPHNLFIGLYLSDNIALDVLMNKETKDSIGEIVYNMKNIENIDVKFANFKVED